MVAVRERHDRLRCIMAGLRIRLTSSFAVVDRCIEVEMLLLHRLVRRINPSHPGGHEHSGPLVLQHIVPAHVCT